MEKENQNKYFWIEAKGKSMFPFIKEGERLLIAPLSASQIKLGDIIAVKAQEKIIIHRIIGRFYKNGELYFREKGDCNLSGKTVSARNVLGRAVIVKKGNKQRNLNKFGWKVLNKIMAFYGGVIFLIFRFYRRLRPKS